MGTFLLEAHSSVVVLCHWGHTPRPRWSTAAVGFSLEKNGGGPAEIEEGGGVLAGLALW